MPNWESCCCFFADPESWHDVLADPARAFEGHTQAMGCFFSEKGVLGYGISMVVSGSPNRW